MVGNRHLRAQASLPKVPDYNQGMKTTVEVECLPEILAGLHLEPSEFGDLMKVQTAIALFRDGRLSSGMAARWLGIPRVQFLLRAMEAGATLLSDTPEDLARETSLL
jgi:hypothetical protein